MEQAQVKTVKQKKKYSLFTNKQLLWLILPIVIESIFSTSLGMVDSMMVSGITSSTGEALGEIAGQAVGNVDDFNNLIIQLFSAFATGGVIITSQYLGAKKVDEANKSAKHVVVIVFIASMAICILSLIFNRQLLNLFFSEKDVGEEVFRYQRQYFYITAASFPFIGMFNVCAALLRAQRKSMVTMTSAGLSLVVNVILNAIFIYVLKMEVIGAALATLISRIVPSVYVMFLITRKRFLVHINIFEKFRFDWKMVKHILIIAIPSGVESCLFQLGKVMTSSFVNIQYYKDWSGGSVNYHANANTMAKSLNNIASVVGGGVNTSCLTVVGQAIGTGDIDQTKYYIKKMFAICFVANAIAVGLIMGTSHWILQLYSGYSETSKQMAQYCLYFCLSFQFVTYPLSFTSPAVLKATSDVKYVMYCAISSMLIVRVGLCWLLTCDLVGIHLGVYGYWIAMCADWCVRSILFMSRLLTGRWKKASGLIPEDIRDRVKGVTKQFTSKGKKLVYTPYKNKGKKYSR
ncbi:MAG: MATE family efflux transporter [Clostridia bacterium]|nr:MATE family efflux transporter [Clostridia bacterium]